jgi:hypothetical protein
VLRSEILLTADEGTQPPASDKVKEKIRSMKIVQLQVQTVYRQRFVDVLQVS